MMMEKDDQSNPVAQHGLTGPEDSYNGTTVYTSAHAYLILLEKKPANVMTATSRMITFYVIATVVRALPAVQGVNRHGSLLAKKILVNPVIASFTR